MDEQSASLNWHDLFLQGQQPNLLDELKFLASPISETTALSKAKTSYHKRTKRIQATETENESTHTVSGALVKNTQAKSQSTPTIVKNPEGKAKRGHPFRTPRKDKSTDGESAVERRKLQVKLAQRAYRQRKEDTAIALERKCDTLKSTIRHLNEELDRFYKMSCQTGIGNREPEYMKDLKQTTKYMSDLVNLALDEGEPGKQNMSSRAIPISPSAESASQGRKRSLSEEPSDQADSSEDYFNSHTSWAASLFADPPRIHSPIANDYIFTAADRLNEFSFPSPFLDSSIGFPPHYGTQGTTFARRLQQDALERGFELITNKKTPPSILNYAFEYCLPTSNREEITNRLRSLLQQSELGSLLNPNSSTYEKCTPEDSQQRLLSQIFGFETRSSPSANSFETRKPEIGPFQLNTELLSAQDVQSYLESRGLEINSSSKLLQLPIAQDNPAWQSKGYRIAILSVNKLLDNILDRAVCLSTGPGFRKVDVESALRTSIRLSD